MELYTNYWEKLSLMNVTILFVLEEGIKDDKTLTASGGKTMLWHQRLGHIGEKGLLGFDPLM